VRPIALRVAVVAAALAAGCDSATPAGPDTSAPPVSEDDAGGDAAPGADSDASADAAADMGGGTDAATKDGGADTADAKDAAVMAKGCKKDGDCAQIQTTSCQLTTCATATGLCQVTDLPDDVTCPNAEPCKVGAVCKAGVCNYQIKVCDDGNPCTDDACGAGGACSHDLGKSKLCVDGSPCTVTAICIDGTCTAKVSVECKDDKPCTVDACDPKVGCTHAASNDGTSCDDGKFCTESDGCLAGACVGKAKVCTDDDNPCTFIGCENKNNQGCTTIPISTPLLCDDGKACTTKDVCSGGACTGVPANCDDQNPCTDDSCDDAKGCQHVDNTKPCGGGDPCAPAGTCQGGTCAVVPVACDDGNQCTQDACDKVLGCQSKAVPAPCFDGSVCTENDSCAGGACKAGTPIGCDDGKACTTDGCDAAKGCTFAPAVYGAACGAGKQCAVGLCLGAECGDGWCAPAEDSAGCAADCPVNGGACAAGDAGCLKTCTAAKCGVPAEACGKVAGCADIPTCVTPCGADLPCQIGCLLNAGAAALQANLALDQCVQAFCVEDSWLGKKCTGGGPIYVACVGACEGAMCKLLSLQCKASAGCVAVRQCLQQCDAGDDPAKIVACIADCKSKAALADIAKNADLDTCSATYCQ